MHQEFLLLNFLLSYLLHSSVLLACVTLAHKLGWLKQRTMAERVWRVALFGALLTASWQVAWTKHSVAHEPAVTIATTPSEFKPTMPPIKDMQSDRTISLSEERLPVAMVSTDAPTDSTIRLPASFKFYAEALSLAWCALAVFVLASISLSVFYLNRKIALMPELEDDELLRFAASRLPARRQIHIHHGDAWSSPLLCPNGRVFLPDWALEELDMSQCKAMLAHEIAHLLRHDRYWRLAHQIMLRLFFFQILNRYAVKQLELLAEFDCDQAALEHSNPESFTQTLMHCAQMHINNHPTFALPMAKPSSLLQRISLLLNEDRMNTPSFSKKSLFVLCIITISCISALSYATPNLRFEESVTSKPALELHQGTIKLDVSKLHTEQSPAKANYALPSTTTKKLADGAQKKDRSSVPKSEGLNQASQIKQIPQSAKINQEDRLKEAQHAWKEHRTALAIELFSTLANEGNAEAQEALGEMLWYGEGASSDLVAAKNWITKAASQGRTRAQQFLNLFAEREKRGEEISFFTTKFNGGYLKWSDQVCPRGKILPSKINLFTNQDLVDESDALITCYDNYIATLQKNLKEISYIPADLLHIMRDDEVESAKLRARSVFFQQGMLAKASIEKGLGRLSEAQSSLNQVSRLSDYELAIARQHYMADLRRNGTSGWINSDSSRRHLSR